MDRVIEEVLRGKNIELGEKGEVEMGKMEGVVTDPPFRAEQYWTEEEKRRVKELWRKIDEVGGLSSPKAERFFEELWKIGREAWERAYGKDFEA